MKDSGMRGSMKKAFAIIQSFMPQWKPPDPVQEGFRKHNKPNGGPPTFKRNRRYQMKHGFKAKKR